ncbi:MAG: phage tail protein [Alcanivorax sediminis]|uniref:phage tail protein n=1 Tax=Alcanivorax sediminis TaxID=2663008 RepID=UPI003C66517D
MIPRMDNPINGYLLRDKRGALLPGGRLEFFDSVTDEPENVWDAGSGQTVSLGEVVYADAYGLLPDFELTPNQDYKLRCYNSDGDFMWDRDGVANNVSDLLERVEALESAVAALGEDSGPKNLLTNGSCKAVREDRLQLGFGVQPDFAEGGLAGVFAKVTNATGGTFIRVLDSGFGSTGVHAQLDNVTTDNSGALAELQWRMPSGDGAAISGDAVVFTVKASQNSGSAMNAHLTLYKCLTNDDFSNLVEVSASTPVSLGSGATQELSLAVENPGDVSTGVACVLTFTCGIVSNTNFIAGEAQLERGLVGTQFEDRPQLIDQAAWSQAYLTPDLLPEGLLGEFPLGAPNSYWLRCNGQAVSRTAYPRLFAYLGVAYGNGDASTTFNLPDYRGYTKRDTDDGAGVDPDAASRTDRGDGTTGDAVGTKQQDELKSHSHTFASNTATGGTNSVNTKLNNTNDSPTTTNATGGAETRMKNINVNTYIHI